MFVPGKTVVMGCFLGVVFVTTIYGKCYFPLFTQCATYTHSTRYSCSLWPQAFDFAIKTLEALPRRLRLSPCSLMAFLICAQVMPRRPNAQWPLWTLMMHVHFQNNCIITDLITRADLHTQSNVMKMILSHSRAKVDSVHQHHQMQNTNSSWQIPAFPIGLSNVNKPATTWLSVYRGWLISSELSTETSNAEILQVLSFFL